MCIKPQALLDAMASKLERDGVEPSARDVAALVASGCTADEVARALERARVRRAASAER